MCVLQAQDKRRRLVKISNPASVSNQRRSAYIYAVFAIRYTEYLFQLYINTLEKMYMTKDIHSIPRRFSIDH